MNRKANVERIFELIKLIMSTSLGCSGVIIAILLGFNCNSFYNMIILPSFVLAFIPLVVYFQKKKNTSKLFYFLMMVIHFFCFIFLCVWDQDYQTYFNNSKVFYCSNDKIATDFTIKIGYGSYYSQLLFLTFFHLLELVLLARKIYELATSKK